MAAVTKETQEEHARNGQSRNTSVPRINEEYITQDSEEIEDRVTKKLSQEFSKTESRILGALSKLDEFLLNPQIRMHSGTVPGTFRNTNVENQEPNEDRFQDDPHPEVGPSVCQSRHSIDSDTDEAPHNCLPWMRPILAIMAAREIQTPISKVFALCSTLLNKKITGKREYH